MGTWYDKVRDRVPNSSLVRDLVESVEQLPGLDRWSPAHDIENHWTELIRWGFALSMTRSLGGVDLLHRALSADILASGRPAPETFSELTGAGLCVGLGAFAGHRIPKNAHRTADWRMVWPEASDVDVEVTIAKRKAKHLERQGLATDLADSLFKADRAFDLVINLADPTAEEDWQAIQATAMTLASGQAEGVAGRWELRAVDITREPTVLFTGGQDPRPAWWPTDKARCFVLKGQLAGPDTTHALPQVRVFFGVPYDSSVNPVMRKADAPQGTEGLPFLVAVDIGDLPGALEEVPRAVAGLLPFWKAVSGILVFHDISGVDRVGWFWRLIRNPHAAVPLPEALCTGRADLPKAMETGVRFTNESKGPG